MFCALIISITIIFASFLFWWWRSKKSSHYPPAIPGWPIIGNVDILLKPQLYIRVEGDIKRKYGDIVTLWMFKTPIVVISDYRKAVNLLVTKHPLEASGRPEISLGTEFTEGRKDILLSNIGPQWNFQRKLFHSALRIFSKNSELDRLSKLAFDKFKKIVIKNSYQSGIFPFDECYLLSYNIAAAFTVGKSYDFDDVEFQKMLTTMGELNEFFLKSIFLFDTFPVLKYLPLQSIRKFRSNTRELFSILDEIFNEHVESGRYLSDPKDIVDFLLKEKEENTNKQEYLDNSHMRQLIMDIFTGGTDTTAVTLTWMIGLLATHPEVKATVRKEVLMLEKLEGREITTNDRQLLPYSYAVLLEVLRISSIAPLGINHLAIDNCKVGEFIIPKGATILLNLHAFHFDTTYWTNPDVFDPARFLTEDGKLQPKKEGWLPFSCGKRTCPGESVAKSSLFMLLCLTCKHLNIRWTEHNERPMVVEKDNNTLFRYVTDYYVSISECSMND